MPKVLGVTPDLLTVPEVAKALRVDDRTVRNYVQRGLLPAVQVAKGAAIRVPRSAVEKLLAPEPPEEAA
jgi:excisionase family DNA binding protein